MELISASGGASVDAAARSVTVRISDDGDVSPPGTPRKPALVRVTGGVAELSALGVDPSNTGGAAEVIARRTILRVLAAGGREPVSSIVAGLRQETTYSFVAVVSNSLYDSPESGILVVTTTRATPPSAPQELRLTLRTGGMLRVQWNEPVDLGGVDISRYVILVYATNPDGTVRIGTRGVAPVASTKLIFIRVCCSY